MNRFNETLGRRPYDVDTRRALVQRISNTLRMPLPYDGARLMFSMGDITLIPELAVKPDFDLVSKK